MQKINNILEFVRNNKSFMQMYAGLDFIPKELQKYQKHKYNALILLSFERPAELCHFFEISRLNLEKTINTPDYKHYAIKKKRGGKRNIFVPEERLMKIQKRLNYFLQAWYLCIKPSEVHGFVINPRYLGKHCNIVANASVHTGKKHVLNIDLKDFFPSISAKRIKTLFSSPYFNYNEQIALALTFLTTYRSKLPTGAPTSPVLSNFVCLELDANLRTFCQKNALHYSRYADDLTFSSDTIIAQDTIHNIIQLINKNGFEINKKKFRLKSSYRKQTVTGLTVNEKVNVDRKLLKKIRAMLHDWSKNGIVAATQRHFNITDVVINNETVRFKNRLKGYIDFVGQVRGKNDAVYMKFKRQFDAYWIEKYDFG